MRAVFLLAAILLALSGCTKPAPTAYLGGVAGARQAVALGKDASGEACNQLQAGKTEVADVFCGTWQQPAARVRRAAAVDGGTLATVATASPWRQALDARFACGSTESTTILGGDPALLLKCTRRIGGWPQVALVAEVGGRIWVADGVLPTLPVIQRSIGILSGRVSPSAATTLSPSAADSLLANVLSAQAFSAGDVGQFEQLMSLGARANLAENFAAAEQAYRAALALQQKALGINNPNTAGPLMHLALQVSDQGRFVAAEALFKRATELAPRADDPAAPARLLHYEALHALNQGHDARALALLRRAAAAYAALLPPGALAPTGRRFATSPLLSGGGTIGDPTTQSAMIGLLETRRYTAIVLRRLGRTADAEATIDRTRQLATATGMDVPLITARLTRTAATTAGALGRPAAAAAGLARSGIDFTEILPETRPVAETALLQAGELIREGRNKQALLLCQRATDLLRKLRSGTNPELLAPCLGAYDAAAKRQPARAQTLLAAMFETAELAQDSLTARQIAEAAARLAVDARDPKVAAAIRRRQDAGQTLADLYRQRDDLARGAVPGTVPPSNLTAEELDRRIAAAQTELSDADSALQAAAPNYGQLVQEVVPVQAVLKALKPDEVFVAITLTGKTGWVFAVRDGRITAAQMPEGTAAVRKLVHRIRTSVTLGETGLPPFDVQAAHALYQATLAPVAPELHGAKALVVAPSGPLLSIPFALLLTGPAKADDLAQAPWLIRKVRLAYVPAAANFVALRAIAGTTHARKPWFGFGDFRPVTLAQAERSFPTTACADSARLFAGLPLLSFARRELTAARLLLGGSPEDELLGADFTVPAVERAHLKDFRVLHFATHALLPSELRCQSEPAIVTSAPPAAKSAKDALLTSDDVMGLKLDANVVILSACNTGGAGEVAGESLSGLARAFFFAGARALMVTHWSISDQSSAYLIAETLRRYVAGGDGGLAGSLRAAQLAMIDGAGTSLPAELAQPFYWAPFALIGDGEGQRPLTHVASRD